MVTIGEATDAISAGKLTPEFIQGASIKQLVDKCTDPKSPADKLDYYQMIHMEIVDRMKEREVDCKQLAKEIHRVLPMDNSIRQQ